MRPKQETVGLTPLHEATAMPGLDFLRGMLEGRYPPPPFSHTTAIWLAEAEHGRVVFRGEPEEGFFNPLGTIHGGWTAAILDSAMACAVHSVLKPGQGYTTVEMKLNLVRPIMPARGQVVCEGKLVHGGGRIATSEGFLRDAEGKLLAHGTETCLIMDMKKA